MAGRPRSGEGPPHPPTAGARQETGTSPATPAQGRCFVTARMAEWARRRTWLCWRPGWEPAAPSLPPHMAPAAPIASTWPPAPCGPQPRPCMEPRTADVAVPPSWEGTELSRARPELPGTCTQPPHPAPQPQHPAPSPLGRSDQHPCPSTGCSSPHRGRSAPGPVGSTGTPHRLPDTCIATRPPCSGRHQPQPLPRHRHLVPRTHPRTPGSLRPIPRRPTAGPHRLPHRLPHPQRHTGQGHPCPAPHAEGFCPAPRSPHSRCPHPAPAAPGSLPSTGGMEPAPGAPGPREGSEHGAEPEAGGRRDATGAAGSRPPTRPGAAGSRSGTAAELPVAVPDPTAAASRGGESPARGTAGLGGARRSGAGGGRGPRAAGTGGAHGPRPSPAGARGRRSPGPSPLRADGRAGAAGAVGSRRGAAAALT